MIFDLEEEYFGVGSKTKTFWPKKFDLGKILGSEDKFGIEGQFWV